MNRQSLELQRLGELGEKASYAAARLSSASRAWLRLLLTSFLLATAAGVTACSTGSLSGKSSAASKSTSQVFDQDGESSALPKAAPGLLDKRAPVKVGLILPLSGNGRTAIIAKHMRQAGELALFEYDNPSVQLIVKDTQGTPEGAKAAAVGALSSGAEIIIGPLFAGSVSAVQPIARQAGVPIVAFSSSPRVAGNGVYLLSFLAGEEIPRIVSYAASRGKRKFAALIPDSPYGKMAEAKFRAAVAQSGGQVAVIKTYLETPNGMLKPAKDLKQEIDVASRDGAPIDALFIPGSSDSLPLIGSMMSYAKIDSALVQLIGTSGWDYPTAGREKALIGAWFPGPDPRGWQDFAKRFSNANGGLPPRLASLTHDAVSLAINLSSAPKGKRYTEAKLTRPSGFSGTDGLYRFSQAGLPERGLAILEVQKFGSRVIDPSASSFGQNLNDASRSNYAAAAGAPTALTGQGARFNLRSQ